MASLPTVEQTFEPDVASWLRDHLADPVVIRTPQQTSMARVRGRVVVEVADEARQRCFLKVETRRSPWRAEVRAYRRWTSAVAGLAPKLLAADRDLNLALIQGLPRARLANRARDHRQAGDWLRRFHAAEPPRRWKQADWAQLLVERVVHQYPSVLDEAETGFARAQAEALLSEHGTAMVPTHGDFRPHNWIVDAEDTVRVIDFGASKWAPPSVDVAGLAYGPWWDHPQRCEEFFTGFQRSMTREEGAMVFARLTMRAVRSLVKAHQHELRVKGGRARERLGELMEAGDLSRLAQLGAFETDESASRRRTG